MADSDGDKTVIVETGGGGGGGGVISVVILIIVVALLLYLFRAQLGFGGDETTIEVPEKIDVTINQN